MCEYFHLQNLAGNMDKRSEIITAEQKQKQNSREFFSLLN